jgi:hypothetical protein
MDAAPIICMNVRREIPWYTLGNTSLRMAHPPPVSVVWSSAVAKIYVWQPLVQLHQ